MLCVQSDRASICENLDIYYFFCSSVGCVVFGKYLPNQGKRSTSGDEHRWSRMDQDKDKDNAEERKKSEKNKEIQNQTRVEFMSLLL